ncbi:Calycin [Cinara cedri]|uniref:Calycin n=1 Tax=Cinara cedri TaxID=506608 RepID=A0A5E4NA89_9HEMI|nr:Calycin [Cinara cedri]
MNKYLPKFSTINTQCRPTDNHLSARLVGNRSRTTNRMRASVFYVSVLVATALACPLQTDTNKCSSTPVPKIVPLQWQVQTFTSQYATVAFQGAWYLQMATPTCIDGANPLKTGLFYSVYPSSCNRVIFYDNTPTNKDDFNLNYYMLDSSFNLITQTIDTSQSVFRPAYPNTNLAIFNIGTQPTYKTAIKEINPFEDSELVKYKLDSYYQSDYTIAIIGKDSEWAEYMVFVVLNEYENLFNSGADNHIIWVFSRAKNPGCATYKKAFDDIQASGLNPYRLISVDQSIDLTTVPTITEDDIKGVVKKTTETEELSTSSSDGVITSSSKKTTIEETTCLSTVDFTVNPAFSTPFKYEPFDLSGNVKILRDLTLQQYASALSGKYYLNAATPIKCSDNGNPGLLNTVFPLSSLQITIDGTDSNPWTYDDQYMMAERSINAITGEQVITRNILQLPYNDGSSPYASVLVYTEGYYDSSIQEVTPFSYDKVTIKSPSDIYKQKYIVGIAAYKPNSYLMLYVYNQFPNQMYPNNPVNPFYVFTKDRIVPKSVNDDITQEILRSGYLPSNLVHTDQTNTIDDDYTFDKSFFYPSPTISPSTPNSPIGTPSPLGGIGPLSQPTYPNGVSPRGLGPIVPPSSCPSSIPPAWQVKTFDSQQGTINFQGTWNLQLATPTKINGLSPVKTGLFADLFPCTKMRSIFLDTTPGDNNDFNTDYYWLDSSFNLLTQQVETVQGLFKAAYPSTNLALFNVCVPKYYSQPIPETNPFDDKDEVRYKLDNIYERQYTVAVIGGDDDWSEYLVFAVVNKYNNIFSGPDDYILWMFTRSENPDYSTYKKAYDDIIASGLNPYGLMNVDQSIDLSSIPTVSQDDINGVVQKTTIKTEEREEKITSSDGLSSSLSSLSTKQTTVETTSVSPFNVVLKPDYVSPYQLDVYKYSQGIKILENLPPSEVRRAFSGKYYVNMALPMSCGNDGKAGILNTLFPSASLYVQFEEFDQTDWSSSKQYMMMDGGLNVITGEVDKTRTIVQSAYDQSCQFNTYIFYTEGYYTSTVSEVNPFDYSDVISKSPGDIYRDKYMAAIAAYKPDSYLALYVQNQFKNNVNDQDYKNQMYVLTRDRILSKDQIDEITQSIAYTGYDVSNLIYIDQTKLIEEQIKLESSYFQIISESSSSSTFQSSSTLSVIEKSSTLETSSSNLEVISS